VHISLVCGQDAETSINHSKGSSPLTVVSK
jgi:hypothetical protein